MEKMAERAGFEPAVLLKEHTGFRNRLDQPLRHLSGIKTQNPHEFIHKTSLLQEKSVFACLKLGLH
jgi:hypothetical protein